MSFAPYVFFTGDCAEAVARYHEIFGGELSVMTFADLPPEADSMPGTEPHHVMHAAIKIGDSLLMASDDPTSDGGPKTGVTVTFTAPDAAEAKRVFDALAEGGTVDMPMEATFFSAAFGMVHDRWGVPWFVDTAEQA